jgi:hypothetical protein
MLRIPAAEPGNIVGYEYEEELQPFVLQDIWSFQEASPVREAQYTFCLISGEASRRPCSSPASQFPISFQF